MLVGEPVRLHSPLTPLEVRDRLKPELRLSPMEAGLMHGRASRRRLFLWLPRIRYFQNHVPLTLVADLTSIADGTLIEGEFRTHPAVLVFLAVWVILVIAVLGMTSMAGFFAAAALIAVAMLLQGLGMIASGKDRAELLDLLDVLIGATPA